MGEGVPRTPNEMTAPLVEQRRETKVVTCQSGADARGYRTVSDKTLELAVKEAGIQSRRSLLQEQCVHFKHSLGEQHETNVE